MNDTISRLINILLWAIPLWLTIVVHEICKAYAAAYFGDSTARIKERLSWNPFKHTDVLGSVLIPMFFWGMRGEVFGWAKDIPMSKKMMQNPHAMVWVALSGMIGCVIMVLCWLTLAHYMVFFSVPYSDMVVELSGYGTRIVFAYIMIQLIPLPPMDAYHILELFIPKWMFFYYQKISHWGLIPIGCVLWFGLLNGVKDPMIQFGTNALTLFLKRWVWL